MFCEWKNRPFQPSLGSFALSWVVSMKVKPCSSQCSSRPPNDQRNARGGRARRLLMPTQKRCIGMVCSYPGTQIFAASITWHVLGKGKGSRVDVQNASPL